MADYTERSRTHFEATGVHRYQRSLGAVGRTARIAGGAIHTLTRAFSPLNVALGGLGGAAGLVFLNRLGEIGSEYETIQARLGGMITAFGFSPNFLAGLKEARRTTEKIYADAAVLPGEAEEYVEIFTTGLPFVKEALGGTLDQMTAFTNKYGAIAASMKIDAAEAAFHLTRMLSTGKGTAMMRLSMFRNLLPYMRTIKGQADLTTKSFNAMTAPERAQLLVQAMKKLDPMIEKMKTSWDAVTGAMKTSLRQTMRWASEPLFESMKRSMMRVANLLLDSNGQLTIFGMKVVAAGNKISAHIGAALERVVDRLVWMSEHWDEIGDKIDKVTARMKYVAPIIGGAYLTSMLVGPVATGTAAAMGASAVTGGASAVTGAATAATGAAAGSTSLALEGTTAALGTAATGAAAAATEISALVAAFAKVSIVLTTVLGTVELLINYWDQAKIIMGDFGAAFSSSLLDLFEVTIELGKAIGKLSSLFSSFGLAYLIPLIGGIAVTLKFFTSALKLIFAPLKYAINLIYEDAQPSFNLLFELFKKFTSWIRRMIGYLEKDYDRVTKSLETPGMKAARLEEEKQARITKLNRQAEAEALQFLPLTRLLEQGEQISVPPVSKMPKGGAKVNQDFRYSRFTIAQKFEEGFDPDRVAIAFAADIRKLGEQRLQSGHEPAFLAR